MPCNALRRQPLVAAGARMQPKPELSTAWSRLSPAETPVINTVAQAAALVDRIASPALRTMLDVSAASQAETEPLHAGAGPLSGQPDISPMSSSMTAIAAGPGQGDTPQWHPCFECFRDAGYAGWMARRALRISVPDGPELRGEFCARLCARHLGRAFGGTRMTAFHVPRVQLRSVQRCTSAPSPCGMPFRFGAATVTQLSTGLRARGSLEVNGLRHGRLPPPSSWSPNGSTSRTGADA